MCNESSLVEIIMLLWDELFKLFQFLSVLFDNQFLVLLTDVETFELVEHLDNLV
jgi:hypothetical protein